MLEQYDVKAEISKLTVERNTWKALANQERVSDEESFAMYRRSRDRANDFETEIFELTKFIRD